MSEKTCPMCGAAVTAARKCPSCGEEARSPYVEAPRNRPAIFWTYVVLFAALAYPVSFVVVTALIFLDVLPDWCWFAYRTIYASILWLLLHRGQQMPFPPPDE